MRNIFDQYEQPENRLTHALMSALDADADLLKRFTEWVTGEKPPGARLTVVEQTIPGEQEPSDEDEAERRGLPDGFIYDDDGWAIIIESKIQSPLIQDQLDRHRRTAEKHGFANLHLVALVAELPSRPVGEDTAVRKWTELYSWLSQQRQSEWARRLASYMEVLEEKIASDYLKSGALTMFTGIPFGVDESYNYQQAKRLLALAMDELRQRSDLKQELGMDSEAKGRPAITGKDSRLVWDFLRLALSSVAENFTEFPHLSFGIHQEHLMVIVTVPNAIRAEFRQNLIAGGRDGFCRIFETILENFNKSFQSVEGAAPWIEVIQRHYPTQRSEPIIDAKLEFDLRTGFKTPGNSGNPVKQQPQWIDAAYEALSNKNCNLQLGVGAIFRYNRCPAVRGREILDHIAHAWLACKPFVDAMMRPTPKQKAASSAS